MTLIEQIRRMNEKGIVLDPTEAALLAADAAFARIAEWEPDNITNENCRDWLGHVEPALAAYRRAIAGDGQ